MLWLCNYKVFGGETLKSNIVTLRFIKIIPFGSLPSYVQTDIDVGQSGRLARLMNSTLKAESVMRGQEIVTTHSDPSPKI